MRRRALAVVAVVTLTAVSASAADLQGVRRVFRPERVTRGNTNLAYVQPCDAAAWIGLKDVTDRALRFRRAFEAPGGTLRFDVTADERFVLWIDGKLVARGPDRGTVENWTYSTYETELAKGRHVVEALVTTLGGAAPLEQMSWRGGSFLLFAEGAYDALLTTGKAAWEVGVVPQVLRFDYNGCERAWAFGTGERALVDGCGLEDALPTDWQAATVVRPALGGPGWNSPWGIRAKGWMLYPSKLPAQTERVVRPGAVRAAHDFFATNACYAAADGADPRVAGLNAMLRDGKPFVVPPKTSFQAAWDLGDYLCAYPAMVVSGGKGARIRFGWAESPRDGKTGRKGDRAVWEGKHLFCFADEFFPDGRAAARFTVPWWRCGRWIQLEFKTGDEPLTVESVDFAETRYPFAREAAFDCGDAGLGPVQDICFHALESCMHETLFDCPFYEQQMYPGDTRVQLNAISAATRDDRMIRRAIELFELARRDDGEVPFNWPTRGTQEGTSYTLCHLLMYGDYARWHADAAWLKARAPGMRNTLFGLANLENEEGLLSDLRGWSFFDWVDGYGWSNGTPPGAGYGKEPQALENLFWVLALRSAAETERALGDEAMAKYWTDKAEKTAAACRRRFWNAERAMFALNPRETRFTEHAQCLALLGDVVTGEDAKRAFAALVANEGQIAPASVYFQFYLFETYFKFGRADLFLKRLDLWRGYVARNLKTVPEQPDTVQETRSDCHAWGSHPLYFLQAGLAGVRPAAPFFAQVRVAPQPAGLPFVKAKTPCPQGFVVTDLTFRDGHATGTVELPEGLSGTFVWAGEELPLKPGVNTVSK